MDSIISTIYIAILHVTTFLLLASRRVCFDKFGEEGLKAGVPTAEGNFVPGYTFHGDAGQVFRDFFGSDNPFTGKIDSGTYTTNQTVHMHLCYNVYTDIIVATLIHVV